MKQDPRLIRLDDTRLRILNDAGVDATLFANEQVPIESSAVDELIGVTELRQTTEDLAKHDPKFFQSEPRILRKKLRTPTRESGRVSIRSLKRALRRPLRN